MIRDSGIVEVLSNRLLRTITPGSIVVVTGDFPPGDYGCSVGSWCNPHYVGKTFKTARSLHSKLTLTTLPATVEQRAGCYFALCCLRLVA